MWPVLAITLDVILEGAVPATISATILLKWLSLIDRFKILLTCKI